MCRHRVLLTACFALTISTVVRADLPDHEFMDRAMIQLRSRELVPFPIYSQAPNRGSVGLNDRLVSWSGATRVYVPPGDYTRSYHTSHDGLVIERVRGRGWQSDGLLDPVRGMAFVNVGWSSVTAEGEVLRKGDYVVYDGGGFVKRSLRPPDPERVEPRDTNRERASELLARGSFHQNVNDLESARATFKEVILEYPDTPSAERALVALKRIGEYGPLRTTGEDPAWVPNSVFVKDDGQSDVAAADHLLSLAKVYRATSQPARAKVVLRGLLERYPDAPASVHGRRVLESLGG